MATDIIFKSLGELGCRTSGVDSDIVRITSNTEEEDIITVVDGGTFHVDVVVANSFITAGNVEVLSHGTKCRFHTWASKGRTKILGSASKSLFDGAFILVQKAAFELVVTFVTKSAGIALLTVDVDVIIGDVVVRLLTIVRRIIIVGCISVGIEQT